MTLSDRLLAHWRERKAEPAAPCREEDLRAFEQREGVTLPEDLRQVFLVANGMNLSTKLGKDDDGFAFWPLADFVSADTELRRHSASPLIPSDANDLFTMADYLDRSWVYAVRLRGKAIGEVVLLDGLGVHPVAPSFTEFVERYIRNSALVFPPETDLDPKTVEYLRDAELGRICDTRVQRALASYFVPPRAVQLEWDYGEADERYLAFIVAELPEKRMAIAYSRHGFGPVHPWGVIRLEKLRSEMDANWFASLEGAFRTSGMCRFPPPPGYQVE
jgi:hypothetical protein